MKRSISVARPARLAALMTIGSGLLSGLLLGCPGSLDPAALAGAGAGAGGSGGSGSVCQDAIFTSVCATAVCHSLTTHSAGLNLTPPVPASRVVGVAPDATSLCNGQGKVFLRANSSPASGLLLDNLQSSPTCGLAMPFAEPMLSQADISCLQQWANGLTAGNNPDGGTPSP